jgi:hypothetical protein
MKLQSEATEVPPQVPSEALGFARALSRGNLAAALGCFAEDGCLLTPDATAVHGRERIRPLLLQPGAG